MRFLPALLIALLLGLLCSIGLAWNFAWRGEYGPTPAWSASEPDGTDIAMWERPGARLLVVASRWSFMPARTRLDAMPAWSSLDPAAPFNGAVIEEATGWPRVCLAWRRPLGAATERGMDLRETPRRLRWAYGRDEGKRALTAMATLQFDIGTRALPYRPIWSGLLLNTLAFGLAWFALWLAVTGLLGIARRLRGRCPSCGYTLVHGRRDGCPECGWGRPVTLPSMASS